MRTERLFLTPQEAREVLQQYYEGTTTDREEDLLCRFLASEAADGGEFDADRAVMGVLAVGKEVHRPHRTAVLKVAGWAVAASVILAAGLWLRPSSPDCVAYIGGKRYTDRNLIMAQVQSTMGELAEAKEAVSVESQMQGLFN
ncbi:MAG: hypothetical protein J6H19_00865 [Bacteroidaceae bacterium]|nr:hypothetical protein [Bacteroidaceae bacterium]